MSVTATALATDIPEALRGARFVSLTTLRRGGGLVATPVEFVAGGHAIYVRTARDSGKVKRIRHDPRVRVATCTMRGRPTGAAFAGTAKLLSDDETRALYARFSQKYGLLWRIGVWLRAPKTQGIRIVLDDAPA